MAISKNEILITDRRYRIRELYLKYDLENKGYISFSGGKDSTVLSKIFDEAIPGNKIPRVFINTGIEYNLIRKYVETLAETDERIQIVNSGVNIKEMLQEYGYPFKSKQHSHILHIFQNSGSTKSVQKYLGIIEGSNKIKCPIKLKQQFATNYKIKISDMCCTKLKKNVAKKYEKENKRPYAILGLRTAEGGNRLKYKTCESFDSTGKLLKLRPIINLTNETMDYYIQSRHIKLCELYESPYNFTRTGCKGCPFALDLKEELELLKNLLPNEYEQCIHLWGTIYDEYRRLNFRLTD